MEDNLHKGADPKLFHFARLNRQVQTEAEVILWEHLRNRKLNGFKFRRQHPIADFIADFFCLECNLVVEVDETTTMKRSKTNMTKEELMN